MPHVEGKSDDSILCFFASDEKSMDVVKLDCERHCAPYRYRDAVTEALRRRSILTNSQGDLSKSKRAQVAEAGHGFARSLQPPLVIFSACCRLVKGPTSRRRKSMATVILSRTSLFS